MERLDKIVAVSFGLSRAQARKAVLSGSVTVAGDVVRDIARKTAPDAESVMLDGQVAAYRQYIYMIMNKPKDVLSATEDHRQKTVLDLLPPKLSRPGLFPVGRLDKTTTGLLLITNDGAFAHQVLAPHKKVPKTYLATLDGPISDQVIADFAAGVTLADGTQVSPALLEPFDGLTVRVQITEGKYHQIKRMFGRFGLGVNELCRVGFAGLTLPDDLAPGQARELTPSELAYIKHKIINKK